MKYKEQIRATTTINEFLRFHINPSKIITANCPDIRINIRRFIIRIYGRHTLFFVEWVISIKLFKVVAKVGHPSLFSGATAVQNRPKSHTFTVNFTVFAPQTRWRWKTVEGPIIQRCVTALPHVCNFFSAKATNRTRPLFSSYLKMYPCFFVPNCTPNHACEYVTKWSLRS